MHASSRPNSTTRTSLIDQLAEWLLTSCPFSTLTILALLVLGFAFDVPRPAVIVAVVISADLLLNLARRYRRTRRREARDAARVVTA
jgi:hypothetical protein